MIHPVWGGWKDLNTDTALYWDARTHPRTEKKSWLQIGETDWNEKTQKLAWRGEAWCLRGVPWCGKAWRCVVWQGVALRGVGLHYNIHCTTTMYIRLIYISCSCSSIRLFFLSKEKWMPFFFTFFFLPRRTNNEKRQDMRGIKTTIAVEPWKNGSEIKGIEKYIKRGFITWARSEEKCHWYKMAKWGKMA